jgi:hypothetical protein
MVTKCTHEKDGRPCGSPAQRHSVYCFFHDPQTADKRRAAQKKGGRCNAVHTPEVVRAVHADKSLALREVRELIIKTMNAVLAGQANTEHAKTVGVWAAERVRGAQDNKLRPEPSLAPQERNRAEWDTYRRDLEQEHGAKAAAVILDPDSRARVLRALSRVRSLTPALQAILDQNAAKARELRKQEHDRALSDARSISAGGFQTYLDVLD